MVKVGKWGMVYELGWNGFTRCRYKTKPFSSFSRDLGNLQVGDETSSFHVGANQNWGHTFFTFVRPCQIPNLFRRLPMELEVTEIGIFTGKWKGTNDGSQPWILMPAQRFPDDDKLEEHIFFFARGCPENVPIIQEMGYSNGILGYSPLIIHTVCAIPYLHGDIFYFHHVTVATSSLMIGGIDWVAAERDLPNLKMDICGHQVSSFTRG